MTEILLRVGAARFGGWTELSVTRSMRAGAGSFAFGVSERNPVDPTEIPIRKGDRAEVLLGNTPIVSGWIDQRQARGDASGHEIRFAGRDATADLVDCSHAVEPSEWRGRALPAIARAIAEPFGIPVSADVDTGGAFRVFKTEPGEEAFAAIKRAAAHRAVVPIADGAGGLLLTRASTERLPFELRRGVNIQSASATHSDRERHSLVRVIGQQRESTEAFEVPVEDAAEVVGEASDPGIGRYRPLVVVAEEPGTRDQFADRAAWEVAERRGRGLSATIGVPGWEHPAGPWRPNVRVRVVDSLLAIRGDMLVTDVTYSLDDAGRRTELVLAPPEAWALRAVPEPPEEPTLELWR